MTVAADANGVVRGKFRIPPGVPAGTKLIEITGQGGASGAASFLGQGTRVWSERQQVQTVSSIVNLNWRANPVRNVDPLAQTFTVDKASQVTGIDLWFFEAPTTDAIVQIRDTTAGFPNQTILAEKRLKPAQINVGGASTRFNFDTGFVYLLPNREYAIVALCNDPTGSLCTAEIGKFDSVGQKWITSQPYTVGVLLSSSNASTWTAHQDRDVTFRLLRAEYAATTRDISLGNVAVAGATDLLLLADEDAPASSSSIHYTLALPGGGTVTVSSGQPVRLSSPITGDIAITAHLSGEATVSPVLYPGAQLLVGTVKQSATYITRAIPAGSNSTVKVIYEALLPSGAAVTAHYAGIDVGDTYTQIPTTATAPADDGFVEVVHSIAAVNEDAVHIKLTLTGNAAARPIVRDLRVIIT